MNLPPEFTKRMERMLGDEYEAFIKSYEQPRHRGLRVNTLKLSPEEFEHIAPFPAQRIPWVDHGYFYSNEDYPAKYPYYMAGLYYLQEPSAMTPADRLPVKPGDRVLDLCAAPGGKATELAAKLQGRGILVANDASNSRAKALLRNLELFGAGNILVTAEMPDRLRQAFPLWFDAIQVDAPCSGEGMFRKSPEVADTWSPERVAYFSKQQRNILENAWGMLRPGGYLMYSTCTFSPEEDEQMISWFVGEHPDMKIQNILPWYEGFAKGRPDYADGNPELEKCVRIWPHRMAGEGHFLCLLRKAGIGGDDSDIFPGGSLLAEERRPKDSVGAPAGGRKGRKKQRREDGGRSGAPGAMTEEQQELLQSFLKDSEGSGGVNWAERMAEENLGTAIQQYADKGYLVEHLPAGIRGMNFLRNGLYLGEWKKKRFEPSQPFAMALSADTWSRALCLEPGDGRIARFLRGESIPVTEAEQITDGWVLVCVKKFSLGWGKCGNGLIKNKLLRSWRQTQTDIVENC